MSKIKAFSKPTLKMLRDEINAALAPVAAKHGIDLHAGNGTFGLANFTLKLNGAVVSDSGVVKDKYRQALEIRYPQYVDKEVRLSNGEKAKVDGYNSRGKKYPFLATSLSSGKRFKMSEWNIR